MPWSASGREMRDKLLAVRSNVDNLISESKEILQPLLEASGKSVSEESTIGSIIDDLGKLTSIEHHIPNGSLSDIKFTDSGLFSKSILPITSKTELSYITYKIHEVV